MTAANTDTFLGERYRRIARRRGKQKAIVAVARTICEIACLIIGDPGFRYIELGAGYYARHDPQRQTRSEIRELEKLNPGCPLPVTAGGVPATHGITAAHPPSLVASRQGWLNAAHGSSSVSGQQRLIRRPGPARFSGPSPSDCSQPGAGRPAAKCECGRVP